MKLYKSLIAALALTAGMASCTDWLEQEPPSYLTPESYFTDATQVQAAVDWFYTVMITHGTWSFGVYGNDNETDNQADWNPDNKYGTGLWQTSLTNGNWNWDNIRNINYQLRTIVDKNNAGSISGSQAAINQYIGELYFLRSYCYFDMLQKWGDLPIYSWALNNDEQELIALSVREPRNEVARFIINSLDSAITLMQPQGTYATTRIGPDAVKLFKSRVALYEGTFLKYFAGTPFVPNGPGWPGAEKDYNAGYQYPTGSVEAESDYFLQVAADASKEIADKYMGSLRTNTGVVPQSATDPSNPYLGIWGTEDMSGVSEVLLWRQYSRSLGQVNDVEVTVTKSNYGIGLTRGFVENYLMKDGRPIYDSQYEYNDTSVALVRKDRDPRLTVFLKEPGQVNLFINADDANLGDHGVVIEPVPVIDRRGDAENGYPTGYAIRKGGTFDGALTDNNASTNACAVFRATEALLNYMEAEYLLSGSIDNILPYWRAVRTAAGFTGDAVNPQVTIDHTDMAQEGKCDWGAYSGGQLLSDKTLYNIRRERRCELIAEGLRWMDLQRWRALDQLIANPVHIEGIHLYANGNDNPMYRWYCTDPTDLSTFSIVNDGSTSANISSPDLSEYMRPHEYNTVQNDFLGGLTWHMAHYLQPMPIRQMILTASDYATPELSPLYQNPYWPTTADQPAEQ